MATIVVLFILFVQNMALAENSEPSKKETQEYEQELARVRAMKASFTAESTNDLDKYEKFVDEIQHKWNQRNKEYYARLMLTACGPLSGGNFKDDRQYDLARKYALAALESSDAISLDLELELTGQVMTPSGPNVPKDENFAERRRKDVEVRLHVWKRLMDAIDPNWNPDDRPAGNITPPAATGFPSGIAPEAIEDATLRAEYEAAIKLNRQKRERYNEQYSLRPWLRRFPDSAESYIIKAYSNPPYNVAELKKSLNEYKIDEKTKVRILDAVIKNTKETQQKE